MCLSPFTSILSNLPSCDLLIVSRVHGIVTNKMGNNQSKAIFAFESILQKEGIAVRQLLLPFRKASCRLHSDFLLCSSSCSSLSLPAKFQNLVYLFIYGKQFPPDSSSAEDNWEGVSQTFYSNPEPSDCVYGSEFPESILEPKGPDCVHEPKSPDVFPKSKLSVCIPDPESPVCIIEPVSTEGVRELEAPESLQIPRVQSAL